MAFNDEDAATSNPASASKSSVHDLTTPEQSGKKLKVLLREIICANQGLVS